MSNTTIAPTTTANAKEGQAARPTVKTLDVRMAALEGRMAGIDERLDLIAEGQQILTEIMRPLAAAMAGGMLPAPTPALAPPAPALIQPVERGPVSAPLSLAPSAPAAPPKGKEKPAPKAEKPAAERMSVDAFELSIGRGIPGAAYVKDGWKVVNDAFKNSVVPCKKSHVWVKDGKAHVVILVGIVTPEQQGVVANNAAYILGATEFECFRTPTAKGPSANLWVKAYNCSAIGVE